MHAEPWVSRIPTLEKLGVSAPVDVDHVLIGKNWLEAFAACVSENSIDGILSLVCDDALWRDVLALTWDIRTFDGAAKIRQFLGDRLSLAKMHDFKLEGPLTLQSLWTDLIWIVGMFKFRTDVGLCSGVFRLVPTQDGQWKAYTIFTNLEDLKGFPELTGSRRSHDILTSGTWIQRRREEIHFAESDPSVLIIGGGHSALALAARLKYLNVRALIVDKEERIGSSWRNRYENLTLHFPVWWDSMPYVPFPATWPVYTPGYKIADWLESYARILDLNIWTSSTVLDAIQDAEKKWSIRVQCSNGSIRTLRVNHLVFATGLGDSKPLYYPGQETFTGSLIYSTQYKRAEDFKGKKVVVIGASNSAFDIASDLVDSGIDVTMFQRSSTMIINIDRAWKFLGGALYNENTPSIDVADRLAQSIPQLLQENGLGQRTMKAITEDYKDVLDGLRKVGFRLNNGLKDAGVALQNKEKAGGYYFDTGASQLVIDGKIKLKNDSLIQSLVEDGLVFENGTKLEADAIICATGLGDMRDNIRRICGDAVADGCPRLLGVDGEGEMSWYRQLHLPGLWYMIGPFSSNRFFSKAVALQIKAVDEKIITSRYTPAKED